jgi:hypothetical protein
MNMTGGEGIFLEMRVESGDVPCVVTDQTETRKDIRFSSTHSEQTHIMYPSNFPNHLANKCKERLPQYFSTTSPAATHICVIADAFCRKTMKFLLSISVSLKVGENQHGILRSGIVISSILNPTHLICCESNPRRKNMDRFFSLFEKTNTPLSLREHTFPQKHAQTYLVCLATSTTHQHVIAFVVVF